MRTSTYSNHLITLALLALACVLMTPINSRSTDLLEVYRQAVAVNPALARSQALLDADRTAKPLARSGLLPRLDLGGGVSRNHAEITGFGPMDIDESYSSDFYSVTLTQPLFNGPAYSALDAADAQAGAGEAALLATAQQLMLKVSEAYFDVLKTRADVNVARDQLALLESVLDQAEISREVGTGDIISVHEARARADAARADLVRAENTLQIARQRLQRLTREPFGRLDDLGPVQAELPQPDRASAWVQAAFDQQPELLRAEQELQVAVDQVAINRRARWPRVDLDAGYSHTKGEFLPDMDRDELRAGVNLHFPLYQGGEIGARTERARSLARANRSHLEDLRDQVRLETETAFFKLQSSVPRLNAASQALVSARTSLEATREGYRVGVRSIVDLLTVIRDLAVVTRDYNVALYDHVTARIRLKAAAGLLAFEDLEAINTLLTPAGDDIEAPERSG